MSIIQSIILIILSFDFKYTLVSLSIISTKTVAFVLNRNIEVPKELNKFKPIISNQILKLSYDKNKTNIRIIIDILNKNQIEFKEINTFEGALEDVFIKVVNKNDTEI